MSATDLTADELDQHATEAHSIAYLLEQHGNSLVVALDNPHDAVALIARMLRLRANRYQDRAVAARLAAYRSDELGEEQ